MNRQSSLLGSGTRSAPHGAHRDGGVDDVGGLEDAVVVHAHRPGGRREYRCWVDVPAAEYVELNLEVIAHIGSSPGALFIEARTADGGRALRRKELVPMIVGRDFEPDVTIRPEHRRVPAEKPA